MAKDLSTAIGKPSSEAHRECTKGLTFNHCSADGSGIQTTDVITLRFIACGDTYRRFIYAQFK